MTREEFQKIIESITDSELVEIVWQIGGRNGGNCWGGKSKYYLGREEEPEFKTLDEILEKVCPKISYLSYKKLIKNILYREEYTEYEYYGNYTVYAKKYIICDELYNYLIENKLMEI